MVEKQRGGRQPSGGLQALTAFQITISGHAWRLARCRHLQPSLSPHSVSFYFRSGLKSNIDSYAQHFKCEVSPPSTLVPGPLTRGESLVTVSFMIFRKHLYACVNT